MCKNPACNLNCHIGTTWNNMHGTTMCCIRAIHGLSTYIKCTSSMRTRGSCSFQRSGMAGSPEQTRNCCKKGAPGITT